MLSQFRRGMRLVLGVVFFGMFSMHAWSQSAPVTPESEYQKRIKVSEDIQPLGENPFGEHVSLYTGATSFEQTDVSSSGIGPSMQISRTFNTPDQTPNVSYQTFLNNAFVDWALEVPHIETMSAPEKNTVNGQVVITWFFIDDYYGTNRCDSLSPAPTMFATSGNVTASYDVDSWWHGYQLIVPGAGSQDLLSRDASNTVAPQMTAADGSAISFPIVTKEKWAVGCLAQTANGYPGKGFLAVSPDGTKYWLDWLIYKTADAVVGQPGVPLQRRTVMMMASKVQDRFGNTVNYTYDGNGNLTDIQASDGRQIHLAYETWQNPTKDPFGNYYNPAAYRVHSVTLQPSNGSPRTWNYTYGSDPIIPRLSSVQLPDGSAWSFNLGSIATVPGDGYLIDDDSPCNTTPKPQDAVTSSGSMTHPSGLSATFTFLSTIRGRSYVPYVCNNPNGAATLRFPRIYKQTSLTQKTFTGAGLPTQTWSYSYATANYSWASDCASGCPATATTDVIDPAGRDTKYIFSNKFDATESLLLETDYYVGGAGSALARSEVSSYASPTGNTWPAVIGNTQQLSVNNDQLGRYAPENQRVTTQDGDTYTWLAEAFDAFAQPTKIKRYNSIAGQTAIEEQTTLLNDLPHWVLGLPQETDNLTTGETESVNTYNLSNVTLQSRSRFGQSLMSYGYDAQGNLASFTDPNNHTTNLSNYKRGIPQTIGYPDGHGQSLVVDDFGQISSLTDQAGNTTSYSYDAIGRITGITYPAGDEVAWAPKTFSYALVASAERGVAANHWRRTTTQGNAVSTTYFDTMLRPILSDTGIAGQTSTSTVRTDYDWKGQKIFVSYPGSASPDITALTTGTHSVYDALERLTDTQQDSELGTLTTHNAYLSGARQQVTDPKSNVTTTAYQVFDQPAYQSVIQVQAPGGITQTISRDIYGNPLSITQSGLYGTETDTVTKTLTYDSFHRLCRTTEPESGSEVTGYDAANNIAWTASGLSISGTGCGQEQVADAAKTNRSYDAMNRVLTLVPPSGTQSTTYTYDPLGNVQTSASGIATWTAGRNKLAQLTSETLNVTGNGSNVLRYSHDTNGHVATISYPDGLVVNYAPDALGRPTQAGSFASNLSYFPDGDVEHFTFGNGADYLVQKNTRQLLSNFSYAKGGTLNLSEDFVYDPNGNITTINDLAGGPRSKSFGYDALNRLTSAQATGLWGTETYSYDPLNNIRSRVSDGQTYSYNYDATNRLASITNGSTTTFSFGYDNRGNVTTKNTTSLVFDQKNQLTQIPGVDSYAYDASGRRVLKTPTSGNPTYYFYTQDGQLLYQFEANSTKSTDYIFLGKKLIARNEGYATTVTGNVDGVNIDGSGNATLSGWACSTGIPASITVEVFAGGPSGGGGTRVVTATANQASEPAVAAICQTGGTTYRFSIPLTTAIRSQYAGTLIYMYGDSPVGNGNLVLNGSGSFQVPAAPTAPAAPASATATVAGNLASITVNWSSSATATSYVLQQKQNSGSWNQVLNSNVTSYTLSNPVDASYSYQVQACNANGCSAFTASNTVSVAHLPTTPASISAPGSSTGAIGISWAAATYATSYTLEQSLNGGAYAAIYSGAATSNSFSVGATGSYTYRVKACNANGCSGYVTSGAMAVTIPPTSAPGIGVPSSSNTGSYTVSWNGVAGATTYVLQEQVNGGGWTTIQNANVGSWAASGKGNGTYGYHVQGCNAGGCGPFSTVGTTVVSLIPATPTGFALTQTGPSDKPILHFSWNASGGASTYNLQYRDPGGNLSTIYSGSATTYFQLFLVTGAVSFHVQACNASGCSAYGSWITTQLVSG